MSSVIYWVCTFILSLCLLAEVNAAKSAKEKLKRKEVMCGACLAMAEEISLDIAGTDKKKKLEVGSFRIRPDGKQDLKQINYRQSETHMTEVLETVCGKMRIFGLKVDEETGHKNYIRRISLDGTPVSERGMDVSDRVYENLLYGCNSILEEHEDEVMQVFRQPGGLDELSKQLCTQTLELCNEENVTSKLWATANAIMEGMKLKTQPKMDAMMAEAEAKRRREQGEGDIPEDDFSMADESTDDDLDVEMGENLDSRIIATRETVHRFPRDEGAGHSEEGTADESSSTKEEL